VLAFLAARLLLAVVARLRRRYQGSWWPDADHAGTGITAAPAPAVRPRQLALALADYERGPPGRPCPTALPCVTWSPGRASPACSDGGGWPGLPPAAAGTSSQVEATQGQANTTEGTEEHGNAGESGEELFGINPESAGLAAAVAAVSLLLAVLPVARPARGCWWP